MSDLYVSVSLPPDETEGVVVIFADGSTVFEPMPGTVAQPSDLGALLMFAGQIFPGFINLRGSIQSIRTRLAAAGLRIST